MMIDADIETYCY